MKHPAANHPIRSIFATALFCIWISISGCAGIAPDAIPTKDIITMELKEPHSVFAEFSSGARYRHQIVAGKYLGVAEDPGGTYYKGPAQCLSSTLMAAGWALKPENVNKVVEIADCGIYLPNDPTHPAKIFLVIGTGINPAQSSHIGVGDEVSKAAIDTALALPPSPQATPLQSGVGAGLSVAVVGALTEAEKGRFMLIRNQQPSTTLRQLLMLSP